MGTKTETKPPCKNLVLDAGPLLSLSPLRGLAERFLTVPQVLSELKDRTAREHLERLGLSAGVEIEVKEADAVSLASVVQFAKKTGDYAVLSHADLCVLALTFALDAQEKAAQEKSKQDEKDNAVSETSRRDWEASPASDGLGPSELSAAASDTEIAVSEPALKAGDDTESRESEGDGKLDMLDDDADEASQEGDGDGREREPLNVTLEPLTISERSPQLLRRPGTVPSARSNAPLFEDPSDFDDGEGEWITPANVALHKACALELLPSSSSDPWSTVSKKGKKNHRTRNGDAVNDTSPREQVAVGCMTADFAMQNVLLQMDLSLVGVEGKRIQRVKTWVLRCHACFKICKDPSRKFCPSCGNPTLLRTSVTASSPTADESTPALQVHLKNNFQYRNRGTIYSIPAPKPGSSKTGTGEGIILREDQSEYLRARKREEGRREREEKKMVRRALDATKTGGVAEGLKIGNWTDPDWIPELLSVGTGGKGRKMGSGRTLVGADGMPVVGYGRKNPNEKRRGK